MKANRIIDHRQRIRRVVAYIDDHIDDELNLTSLAAVACLSPFHFQRVYQTLVGETPSDTVRRLRLQRAAIQLARGEVSAVQAAGRAGYGSSQAFCRAFRRKFGLAPSRVKKAGAAWLEAQTPQCPSLELVELPATIGYGLRHQGGDWNGSWSCCQIIGRALAEGVWDRGSGRLIMQYRSDPLSESRDGVEAEICIVDTDERLAQLGFDRFVIAGGSFALLRLHGAHERAMSQAANLLRRHLPELGMARRAAPVLRRFTKDLALTPPSEWEFELYVPVQNHAVAAPDFGGRQIERLEPATDNARLATV